MKDRHDADRSKPALKEPEALARLRQALDEGPRPDEWAKAIEAREQELRDNAPAVPVVFPVND